MVKEILHAKVSFFMEKKQKSRKCLVKIGYLCDKTLFSCREANILLPAAVIFCGG